MIESVNEGILNYRNLLQKTRDEVTGIEKTNGLSIATDNKTRLFVISELSNVEEVLGLTPEEIARFRHEFGLPV